MEIKTVKRTTLKMHPRNPNKHSDDQIARLAKLIGYQGIRLPVIVSNLSGCVVAGHGRLMAYEKLGIDDVPVSFQDFKDEAQEYAFMVSDNAIKEWSELDMKMVNEDFVNFGPDMDLDFLGLDDFGMNAGDEPPKKKKGKTQTFSIVTCPECGHEFEPTGGDE